VIGQLSRAEGGEALANHVAVALEAADDVRDIGAASLATHPRWHAVWTRSNCEQLVHDQLASKGFRSFLPKLHVWTRRHGHRCRGHMPMFPGYVFLQAEMDKPRYLAVSRVPGLVRVLGERWDRLAVVPDQEIDAIQRVVMTRLPVTPHPYLRQGQRVRITAGPFMDIEGILIRTKPSRGLLVVSIHMLQRSIAAEVDCTLVQPV
jgi:transcription termination/antitermination protein NusG